MLMKSKMVLLIGPRSNKELTYGMSIGFDLLISGFEDRKLPHIVIDRSTGMIGRKVGAFSLGGIFATLTMLLLFWRKLPWAHIVYITVGISTAGFFRDMMMIWSGWFLRKRIILHLYGGGFLSFYKSKPALIKKMISATFAKADVLIVEGRMLRNQLEFVADVDNKLKVIPNGLPIDLRERAQINQIYGESGPVKLLYLSNMIQSKGYLDLLEACRILYIERRIPIHCDFCGAFLATVNDDGEISPEMAEGTFRRLIDEKGLTAVVQYHGTVRGERKEEILREADIFILPTSYPWEGQPISIIEALAHGLPVVATNYRGIPEQIIDGFNGFLLEEKSPREIADAVEKLWQDPYLYKQVSRNARQHYQQNFTREAHLGRMIPVILGQDT